MLPQLRILLHVILISIYAPSLLLLCMHTGIFILFAETFTYFSFFFTIFSLSPLTLTHDDSSLVQVTTSYTHSLFSPPAPVSSDSSTLDLTSSFTCMCTCSIFVSRFLSITCHSFLPLAERKKKLTCFTLQIQRICRFCSKFNQSNSHNHR